MFLIIYFIRLKHFSQAGTRRVYIMRTVDEEDEENFPLKYLQQRQVLLRERRFFVLPSLLFLSTSDLLISKLLEIKD